MFDEHESQDGDRPFAVIRDHHVAGIIIFVTAFCGAFANYIILSLIDKVSSLQNVFGRLTFNQAIGEAVHLTIFTLYFAPTVFFDIKFLKSEAVSRIFGHINLVCYDICIYSHLVISSNRLTAIYFPFKYNTIFSTRNVQVMVVAVYVLAIVPSLYMYIYQDCRLIYSDAYWNFDFTKTQACYVVGMYGDFARYVLTVTMIALLDVVTFVKVRISSVKVNIDDSAARKKRQNEITFVKQVCLQGVVFVCELITYFFMADAFESKWARFFLTTFAWIQVHSFDAYITLFFNKGFFRAIRLSLLSSNHFQSTDTYAKPQRAESQSIKH
ncbi:unnamed protein product, partial [Mesorhabditis belari]|uniref:G-protein coupled receptors family 1 profile domain-containing protein n=1 Tax=Mesorhabditis belari TaxID=2138241 RepID=A0AAF3FCR1_9BILA